MITKLSLISLFIITIKNNIIQLPPITNPQPYLLTQTPQIIYNNPKVIHQIINQTITTHNQNQQPQPILSSEPFLCQQNGPEIEFTAIQNLLFLGAPEKIPIIADFENINGYITTMRLPIHPTDPSYLSSQIANWPKNKLLSPGKLLLLENTILFINKEQIIKINSNSNATILSGYEGVPSLSGAVALNGKYFAIANEDSCIQIYQFKETKVEKVNEINKNTINEQNQLTIKDIAYYPQTKTIYIIDQHRDILSIFLPNPTLSPSATFQHPFPSSGQCTALKIYHHSLIASCSQLQVYHIGPDSQQGQTIQSNIKNKQVNYVWEIEKGDILGYGSEGELTILYKGQFTRYLKDSNVRMYLAHGDKFISISNQGITTSTYKLIQPYVTCQSTISDAIMPTSLTLKTTAPCDIAYIETLTPPLPLPLPEISDICIYTSNFEIVQNSNLPNKIMSKLPSVPILIGLSLTLAILFWAILCRNNKNNDRERIENTNDKHLNMFQKVRDAEY